MLKSKSLTFLYITGLMALALPAGAQQQPASPPGAADPSGQYAPLHPLAPPAPGSVDVLPDMPPVHTQADVTYVSGGIGGAERAALRAAAPQYNLHLLFAGQGNGEYLSSVKVTITDERGVVVLDAVSDGPYFMARLPAGRYRISADIGGSAQTRAVSVPARGAASTSFFWRT
jgi:hypothetical protein